MLLLQQSHCDAHMNFISGAPQDLPTQLGAATVEEAVLTELLSELAVTQGGNLNSGKRETLVHSPTHFPASRTEGKQQRGGQIPSLILHMGAKKCFTSPTPRN